jgi:EAL domain-containing protein (putative c-di-GMP-specific phosphodiesterase class I)
LIDDFMAVLSETGACPNDLVIEVTETALMSDTESNLRTLRHLAGIGMRIAVDDFGTGYSSLAQLLRLPVSVLKIDRALIEGIDSRRESRIVTAAVIRMGQTLGHRLVAEGVETEAQLNELRALGCNYGQGHLFGRPLDPTAIVDAIARSIEAQRGTEARSSLPRWWTLSESDVR